MVVAPGPGWKVKIGDFGISKRRQQDVTSLHTLQRGTLGYAAPEVLGFGARNAVSTSYTSSVDIWSLAAITYRLLTGVVAFPNVADIILYATGNSPFPSEALETYNVSEEGQAFVKKLMLSVPRERPSAKLATEEPWLKVGLDNAGVGGDGP